MNIEKTECERLGYKYITIFECLLSFIHHTPFANEFISNNALKELEDLYLKLFTGDIEIIEFGRKICKYDIEDRIQEKDKQIERLNNENHNLYQFIYEFIRRLEHIRDNGSKTYIKENLDLVIKYMNKEFKEYYKLKELKKSGNNV